MIEQILLTSGSFDGVREIGGFGQPLHALYPQIRAVLASELEPAAGWLLAEPVVDRAKNRIDWYTQGDPDHKPVALSELPDEQRRPMLARLDDLIGRGRDLAERYASSDDVRRAQLGAILRAVLVTPAETEVFLVDGKLAFAGWGFAPDRPWDAPNGSARRPIPPAEPTGSARDVVVPEVAIPELVAAPEPASLTQSSVEVEQPAESLPPPLLGPAMETPEPSPVPAAITPEVIASPQAESPPLAEPESAPVAAGAEATPTSKIPPPSSLRYVVVGSRYFWSVVVIAVLLVLLAAYWGLSGERSLPPIAGEATRSTADTKLDGALTRARQDEAELRIRLEQLLVQLAGRRGQCPATASGSVGAGTLGVVPVLGEGVVAGAIPASPSDRVALSPPNLANQNESDSLKSAPPSSTSDAVLAPSATPAGDAGGQRVEISPDPSTVAERPILLPSTQASPAGVEKPPDAVTRPPTPASPAPSDSIPTARSLEEVLAGRELPPGPAVRTPPSAEPPVKAEPTPEERQEFANRMTATGATTGEITATLLWNSQSDLDLVVRCPSGKQLDFRDPAGCGGTLDVDANTARSSLSDRPVENAFWPAGKAEPGVYEVAVRYIPRKDEERPQTTPFQVRLIRGGQESVFKGAIRPNAVVPVTTFNVQR